MLSYPPPPPPPAMLVKPRAFLWLFTFLLLTMFPLLPPSQAQALPDCPWPVDALITSDTTFTLTENCKVTDRVRLTSGTLTINGGGFTVDASALTRSKSVIGTSSNTNLVVSNVTILGGGLRGGGALHLGGSASISNTTLRDVYRSAIIGSVGTGGTYTLTNILVENVAGVYFHYGEAPMAVQALNNGVFTINNLVVRNATGGNSAVGIFPGSVGSITMTGCFTADGVWTQAFFGGVDRSGITGLCSGSIGNGDTAARQIIPATASACGMPLGGFIETDVTYNLVADCQMTGALFVMNGVTATINGNRHVITGAGSGTIISTAGQLTIRNAVLSSNRPILGFQRNQLRVENTAFRGGASPVTLADHSATFLNTLFEDNTFTGTVGGSTPSALRILFGSAVTVRDSAFRGNSGGVGAIFVGLANAFGDTPSLTFEGCVTLENNSPTDFVDAGSFLTDNSSGPCPNDIVVGPEPLPVDYKVQPKKESSGGAASQKRVRTCPDLAPEIIVTDLTGSTQCQRIEGGGIGKPHVLAAGVVNAVDVWSWVGNGTRVCFRASGAGMVFLDAAYAPRTVSPLPAYRLGDLTCTTIDGEGSVLLLSSTPAGLPPLSITAEHSWSIGNCMVKLRHNLRFRANPGGEVMSLLPAGDTLTALQRTPNWFEVDYHGQRGWISAAYVEELGDCA